MTEFQKPLGLDIGGANLKSATLDGRAWAESFALWREPQRLVDRLRGLLHRFPDADSVAATMTGELVDCFATKAEGVAAITRALVEAAAGRPLGIWTTSGRLVNADEAMADPLRAAAANWHALATWAGRLVPQGGALLFDVGSTTSDLIPLRNGRPCSQGTTDLTRQLAGELVYTGARRTPVCALSEGVTLRGVRLVPAAEWFATMLDVHLLLGHLDEEESNLETANGRPATRDWAADRLARAFCCDRTEITPGELQSLATQLAAQQAALLARGFDQVWNHLADGNPTVIVSGSGSFLARRVITAHPRARTAPVISLDTRLTPALAESAPAYAVAVLAHEGAGGPRTG